MLLTHEEAAAAASVHKGEAIVFETKKKIFVFVVTLERAPLKLQ